MAARSQSHQYKIIFLRYAPAHPNGYSTDDQGRVRNRGRLWLEKIELQSGKTLAHLWVPEAEIVAEGVVPRKPRQRVQRRFITVTRTFALQHPYALAEIHSEELARIREALAAARVADRYM